MVILYVRESPSASVPAKVIFLSVSSSALTVWTVATATSLTAFMVTVKDVSTVKLLEVPVSVIATIPFWFSWKSSVRISLDIEATIFPLGVLLFITFVISLSVLSTSVNVAERSMVVLAASSSTVISSILFSPPVGHPPPAR